ncbi:MAG: hypothetical protein ACRDQ7_08685 [Haloechinothrix sp.]
MTTPKTTDIPGISIDLPAGFIQLPGGDVDEAVFRSLASDIATTFGLAPDAEIDQGLAETTTMLLTMGAAASAGGSAFTSAGFFRSPDDPQRPIMALVSVYYVESEHHSVSAAVAGLEQLHKEAGANQPAIVDLPAGRSVITKSRTPSSISIDAQAVEIVQHSIVAWIPNPNGNGVAGVAVSSNNSEDLSHVEDLARGVFHTFEWDDPREATAPVSQ